MPSVRRLLPGSVAGAAMLIALAAPAAADGASSHARGSTEPRISLASVLGSPAGNLPSGPRKNGTAILPDGRFVTPVGRSVKVPLEPMSSFLSHDGRRLYVSSEGQDDKPLTPEHERYFSIIDTATMRVVRRVRDDGLQSGIVESKDGRRIYVAQGQWDSIGVFRRTPSKHGGVGTIRKIANWRLHPKKPTDMPWGIALSPNGKRLYTTGFSGDSLFTIDTLTGAVLSRVKTGAYPYAVVLSPDGKRAYVSNWGQFNADAALGVNSPIAPPPATYGGYNSTNSDSVWTYDISGSTPKVVAATKIGENLDGSDVDGGSSPSGMALSPDGHTLAVTSSNDDEVALLDVTRTTPSLSVPSTNALLVPQHPATEIDMRVLVGTAAIPSPTGAEPNAAAWSPDGKVLFVAEGERNDVAVIDPAKVVADADSGSLGSLAGSGVGTQAGPNRAAITGRIPTAWYPSSLAVSADSDHLYVTAMKGLGAGPSKTIGTSYIPNDIHGRVSDVSLAAACPSLQRLSGVSDRDNGLVPHGTEPVSSAGNGYVVPTAYGRGPSKRIKHVFLVIKENRSFDNVFGDLKDAEASGRLTMYGRYVTPNAHLLANQFALSDNYDVTAETSTQGHYSIDTGQDDEFVEKTTPTNYSGKFPYGAWDTVPENIPEGGFIWNNAARHGVRTTVFGEATVVVGLSPTIVGRVGSTEPVGQLVPGLGNDGLTVWDPLYPTQVDIAGSVPVPGVQAPLESVYPWNDEGRASAFAADLAAAQDNPSVDKAGSVLSTASIGALNVLIVFDDHTSGYIAGAQTPERQVAENDHGFGRIVSTITHSSYWKNSAIFVTEDDTQGGQDHVDAYRSFGMVISPWAKRHYVSHVHTSFASMIKTIDLILGLPPTSLEELTATSMQDMFVNHGAPNLTPTSVLKNNTQPSTNYSVAEAPNPTLKAAARLAKQLPHGIDMGGDLLPRDLELARAGELQAHDPNVKPAPRTFHHDLAHGSPAPATEGKPVKTGGRPASSLCLTAAAHPASPRSGGHHGSLALLFAGVAGGWWTVRRRRRTPKPLLAGWDTSTDPGLARA